MTKSRSQAAFISKGKARPDNFTNKAVADSDGPGAYEVKKQFGKDVKTMTISRTARYKEIEETAGPGQYDLDRATSVTKTRN